MPLFSYPVVHNCLCGGADRQTRVVALHVTQVVKIVIRFTLSWNLSAEFFSFIRDSCSNVSCWNLIHVIQKKFTQFCWMFVLWVHCCRTLPSGNLFQNHRMIQNMRTALLSPCLTKPRIFSIAILCITDLVVISNYLQPLSATQRCNSFGTICGCVCVCVPVSHSQRWTDRHANLNFGV